MQVTTLRVLGEYSHGVPSQLDFLDQMFTDHTHLTQPEGRTTSRRWSFYLLHHGGDHDSI